MILNPGVGQLPWIKLRAGFETVIAADEVGRTARASKQRCFGRRARQYCLSLLLLPTEMGVCGEGHHCWRTAEGVSECALCGIHEAIRYRVDGGPLSQQPNGGPVIIAILLGREG